jgi:hypothetical protein
MGESFLINLAFINHLPISRPKNKNLRVEVRVLRVAEENSYPLNIFMPRNKIDSKLLTLDIPNLPMLINRRSGDGAEELGVTSQNAEAC